MSDLQHHPLPYVVVLRSTEQGDDLPAQRWEKRVTAYSVMEAVMQAMFEVSGIMPSEEALKARFAVEHVAPDPVEYWKQLLRQKLEAKKVLGA